MYFRWRNCCSCFAKYVYWILSVVVIHEPERTRYSSSLLHYSWWIVNEGKKYATLDKIPIYCYNPAVRDRPPQKAAKKSVALGT